MSKQGKIILIEDDPDDQLILQEVLTELGVKNPVLCFGNGEDAFNYLMSISEKPFIIISDINMPGMNGVELKKKIDNTDYLRHKAIPFIFLTTASAQAVIDNAYRTTDLQGFFQKSATMSALKARMKLILDYWREALHPNVG